MRTAETVSISEQYFWQALAAAVVAGLLLAIPTPVAADSKKELRPLHPVSPAIHGLMVGTRITEQAPPAKDQKHVQRTTPLRKQLKGLPQHSIQTARQQAAFARRVLATRLPAPDRPQKPRLLQQGEIRLIDGDTFTVGAERFRIRGINAPETTEVGGFSATQRLDLLLHEGPVLVIPYGQDTYGRTLAEVYVNNRNVAEVMKEEGHGKSR
jgi:endonuclease YncB( thermonuclease family)